MTAETPDHLSPNARRAVESMREQEAEHNRRQAEKVSS